MTLTRVSSKPTLPEAVLAHIEPGADIVMPNANREPVELVDTLERRTERLLARGDVLRRGAGLPCPPCHDTRRRNVEDPSDADARLGFHHVQRTQWTRSSPSSV